MPCTDLKIYKSKYDARNDQNRRGLNIKERMGDFRQAFSQLFGIIRKIPVRPPQNAIENHTVPCRKAELEFFTHIVGTAIDLFEDFHSHSCFQKERDFFSVPVNGIQNNLPVHADVCAAGLPHIIRNDADIILQHIRDQIKVSVKTAPGDARRLAQVYHLDAVYILRLEHGIQRLLQGVHDQAMGFLIGSLQVLDPFFSV